MSLKHYLKLRFLLSMKKIGFKRDNCSRLCYIMLCLLDKFFFFLQVSGLVNNYLKMSRCFQLSFAVKEICRYGHCTPVSRNFKKGEKVKNAGHVVVIGKGDIPYTTDPTETYGITEIPRTMYMFRFLTHRSVSIYWLFLEISPKASYP